AAEARRYFRDGRCRTGSGNPATVCAGRVPRSCDASSTRLAARARTTRAPYARHRQPDVDGRFDSSRRHTMSAFSSTSLPLPDASQATVARRGTHRQGRQPVRDDVGAAMTPRRANTHLLPTLLDRLCDAAPQRLTEAPGEYAVTRAQMRDIVQRDLAF